MINIEQILHSIISSPQKMRESYVKNNHTDTNNILA